MVFLTNESANKAEINILSARDTTRPGPQARASWVMMQWYIRESIARGVHLGLRTNRSPLADDKFSGLFLIFARERSRHCNGSNNFPLSLCGFRRPYYDQISFLGREFGALLGKRSFSLRRLSFRNQFLKEQLGILQQQGLLVGPVPSGQGHLFRCPQFGLCCFRKRLKFSILSELVSCSACLKFYMERTQSCLPRLGSFRESFFWC